MKTLGAVMCALAIVVTVVMAQGAARVLKLEELTYTDIDRLDRTEPSSSSHSATSKSTALTFRWEPITSRPSHSETAWSSNCARFIGTTRL